MIGVVSYLSVDGVIHVWDAANRGGAPLCQADTFPCADQSDIGWAGEPEVCDPCTEVAYGWAMRSG
jgi:hypothetical protein